MGLLQTRKSKSSQSIRADATCAALSATVIRISRESNPRKNFINSFSQLLESRNVLITICQTTEYLQKNGICTAGISLFAAKDLRTAELKLVTLDDIVEWIVRINRILQDLFLDFKLHLTSRKEAQPDWDRTPTQLLLRNPLKAIMYPLSFLDTERDVPLSHVASLWSFIARALDLAVVSYCGAHLEVSEENYNALHLHHALKIEVSGDEHPDWIFSPVKLDCMDTLLQGKSIWVLESTTGVRIRSPARILASIEDLADLWGPVWKLVEPAATDPGCGSQCYYGIGPGAIVRWIGGDDVPCGTINCHYLPSVAELQPYHFKINISENAKLLIGSPCHSPQELSFSCTNSQAENLCGLNLRPLGTSERTRYRDATTYNLAGGYSGVQIGASRIYKFRDAITWKQRIVSKWRLEPEKRNPAVLSLWLGLEVSLCTRNARRRRLIQLLGSETLSRYSNHTMFKWNDSLCQEAFETALRDDDPKAVTDLYVKHEEWRPDLGRAISLRLDALGSTGVMPDGNLEAFIFVEDSSDPEQVVVLPGEKHTWVSFLKDTVKSATFAMASNTCLSFPYPAAKGQRCRRNNATNAHQRTILQTAIVPAMPDSNETSAWSSEIPEGKCLALDDMKRCMLRLICRLPNGDLILRWSNSEWARAAVLILPRGKDIIRFREYVGDSAVEERTAAAAYLISKRFNELPPLQRSTRALLSSAANTSSTTVRNLVTDGGPFSTRSEPFIGNQGLADSRRHTDTAEGQLLPNDYVRLMISHKVM